MKPRMQILAATKGKKAKRKGGVMGSSENQVVRMSGRYLVNDVSATNVGLINFNPLQMDARLVTISDAWLEYRFVRAQVRCWVSNTSNIALCSDPNILSVTPSTLDQFTTFQQFATGNGTFGSPFPKIKLSGAAIRGAAPVKWFRRGTAVDDSLETQAQIYYLGFTNFSTTPIYVLVEYEIEFRVPAATALTDPLVLETDPVQLARYVAELQQVLGLEHRLQRRRPLPLAVEEKESKPPDYLLAEEPVLVKSPSVVGPPKAVLSPGVPATPRPGPVRR